MKLIRIAALLMAIIFLFFSFGCSHTPKQPPNPSPPPGASTPSDTVYSYPPKEKWWEKDENQYLIVILIILGVALAAGATVAFVSNGGLHVGVSK